MGGQVLRCFYCGRKSTARWDGQLRKFDCANCEATNYLDEKGDITDPPVAASAEEAPPIQFARPKSPSPLPTSSAPTTQLFCQRCLTNQRMVTASLAQYLPEDASETQEELLMKKYREYKATLERRYPPCCKECWPKVSKQIRRSRYGARTDHLRHSIEQAQRNRALTRRTWLDLFNGVGASLFFGGLVLQLVWHASVLLPATMTELGQDGRSSLGGTLPRLETVVKLLPASATLISWSILSSLLSCWWNPFWAQTVRGFTRHLRGFQSWYSYQALIVLGRILSWQLSSFVSEYAKILGCHAIISVVTLVLYVSAMKAIKKVPTALFENDDGKYPWEDAGGSSSSPQKSGNIYDILDEVLQTPSPPRGGVGDSESYDGDEQFLPRSVSPHGTAHSSALNLQSGSQGLMSLADVDRSLRESVSPPPPEYSQEMDWMPTQSKWRAFDSASATGREGQRFGAAPVARRGPFWYRVPDAPTTPAQRLRNPPNKPQIRTSPAQAQAAKKEPLFPRAGPDVRHSDGGLFSTANGNARQGLRDVEFAQPRFFASQDEHVAGLADALSRSFTISDDGMVGDDGSDSRRPTMTASPRLGLSFYSSSRGARLFQLALLVGALAAWLELMQLEQQQQTEQLDQGSRWWFASHVLVSSTITTSAVRLVLLTLTAILAVRAAAETVTDMGRRTRAQQQQQGPGGGGGSGDGGIGDTGISTLALIFLAVAQVALALYAAARILSDMEWVGTTPLPPISNVDSDGYETSEVLVDVGVGNGLAGAGSMGPIAAAVPACDAGCLIQGAWLIGTVAMHEAWNALAGSA